MSRAAKTSRARFPGYDVLDQRMHWDARTRRTVLARLGPMRSRSFFTAEEEPVCRALFNLLLALDEPAPPVFEMVDARLAGGQTDGWHYDDMPPDAEAWRRSIGELARRRFTALDRPEQEQLIESTRTGEPFAGLPGKRLFDLWMRYLCTAYYSHPWAWNEIGFGGPAYPRGYKNFGLDRREPWEVSEAGARDPVPPALELERRREDAKEQRRAG